MGSINKLKDPFSLLDKKILVTGASSGIGRSIAIEISKFGAKLIITGRDKIRLDDTFSKLHGENNVKIEADLTVEADQEILQENLSNLDGIVHSAGVTNPKPFSFLTRKDIDYVMNINFFAPTILTNGLIRKKSISKGASIVFISSISGIVCSTVGGSAYSSSKGAINGLVKGMALDLANKGIRVNCILPGMIETDIYKNSSITQEQLELDRKRYPLGRYGSPEDVAYGAIYLLSDASKWMTGSNIVIDGGYTLI